eukprot:839072-Prorocentrum_minimum.AAC.1
MSASRCVSSAMRPALLVPENHPLIAARMPRAIVLRGGGSQGGGFNQINNKYRVLRVDLSGYTPDAPLWYVFCYTLCLFTLCLYPFVVYRGGARRGASPGAVSATIAFSQSPELFLRTPRFDTSVYTLYL